MRCNLSRMHMVFSGLLVSALLAGCGSSNREGAPDPVAAPTAVGSASCVNICHAATQDITGNVISATWAATTHTTISGVQCEDCHGGGSLHRGVGPIPFSNPPAARCLQATCHPNFAPFTATRHGNANQIPDAAFSQIATPVSAGRHVEECSRCHNPNQRFDFDFLGNMTKPSLAALPAPAVSCASCHDGHQPQLQTVIPQRALPVGYPVFRKYLTSTTTGQQVNIGTAGAQNVAAFIFQPNGAVEANGTVDYTNVVGRNNEINPDRLCAACHAKGLYKNSGLVTHQEDIFTQWNQSGHGNRDAAAFAEFSANPPAYTDAAGNPFPIGTHRTAYPVDMAITAFSVNGPAGPTTNGGQNNFACFKCHNGLTSIAYLTSTEGTPLAPVVFGDATVTCITCHNPHADAAGRTSNLRTPVVMTKYNAGGLQFSGNVFLDNTPVPDVAGDATICIFCHQGRESGFTLFRRRLAAGATVTGNFLNEHYLGTGGMLWGRNAYEYGNKLYGDVAAHQQTNCTGCHMNHSGRNDLGGHSWHMFSEVDGAFNNASCNTASCHSGRVPATRTAFFDFRDTVFDPTNDYDGDAAAGGIAREINGLSLQLRDLLQSNGVFYNDLAYPYFFTDATFTVGFTAWTRPKLKAAFNLQYVIKGLPSSPVSQIGQPNPSAAAHNYRYNIQLLRDSYDDLWTNEPAGRGVNPDRSAQVRPAGTRPATNYLPNAAGPGGYDPNQ